MLAVNKESINKLPRVPWDIVVLPVFDHRNGAKRERELFEP